MSWLHKLPAGKIARGVVLIAYLAGVAVQQLVPNVDALVVGVGFLVLVLAACIKWRPKTGWGWLALLGTSVLFTLCLLSEPPFLSQLGVGLLIFLLSALGLLQRSKPLVEYICLCRYPILIAVIFLVLPWLSFLGDAERMLGNLFDLTWVGLMIVTTLATLVSWVLMVTTRLILSRADELNIRSWNWSVPDWMQWKGHEAKPPESALWFAALLATQTISVALYRSWGADPWYWQIGAVLTGVLLARGIFYLGRRLSEELTHPVSELKPGSSRRQVAQWFQGNEGRPSSRVVAGFFVATFLFYVGGYFYLHPEGPFRWGGAAYLVLASLLVGWVVRRTPVWVGLGVVSGLYIAGWYFVGNEPGWVLEMPALAYILVLTILVGWLLPLASFFADRHRVPTLPVLVTLPMLLYFIVDIDHYYHLEPPPESAQAVAIQSDEMGAGFNPRFATTGDLREELPTAGESEDSARPPEILTATNQRISFWQDKYPDQDPMLVLVAASGGGITASLWTAHVLATVQEECPQVIDGTHLISTVSGGGVGAMYFLDAYRRAVNGGGAEVFEEAVTNAGTSSLSASTWGLAYPDFWRAFSLRHPLDRMMDRAWAMEKAWERPWRRSEREVPTLDEWGTEAREGLMPTMVLNATVSETGGRFLMPTLNLRSIRCAWGEEKCDPNSDTLPRLYEGHGMSVVTAARLSATFPFISPIARALPSATHQNGYHIADGGYYDNFGVVTMVEWLLELFDHRGKIDVDYPEKLKILILEISAYPSEVEDRKPKERAGWLYAAAGPLTTMMQVRTASQRSRNDLDIELIEKIGEERQGLIKGLLENFGDDLGDALKAKLKAIPQFEVERIQFHLEDANAPVSWHLSAAEEERILADQESGLSEKVQELKQTLPAGACPGKGAAI